MFLRYLFLLFFLLTMSGMIAASDDIAIDSTERIQSRDSFWNRVDSAYIIAKSLPQLYDAGEIDSVFSVLASLSWFARPHLESTGIFILRAIYNDEFTEDLYDSSIIYDMAQYRHRYEVIQKYGHFPSCIVFGRSDDIEEQIREILPKLALRMQQRYPPGTIEHLWTTFYLGEFDLFFRELKTSKYGNTRLQKYYLETQSDLAEHQRGKGLHVALITGIWMPQGNNKLLGNKAETGIIAGSRGAALQIDFTLFWRYLRAKNEYRYFDSRDQIDTKRFIGAYCGLDFSYQLLYRGNSQIDVLCGIGYDGFGGKNANSAEDQDQHHVESLNFNIGFRQKLFLSHCHDWYIGIQGRYNWVKYGTHGGSDLSGNTISLELIIGALGSYVYKQYAKPLGF